MTARDRLATTGVWHHTDLMSAGEAAEFAGRLESLGYSTLWLPETAARDPFAHIAWLGSQTSRLQFATGIANIYHRHPGAMLQATNTLAEQTGGRFVLGLGVSHHHIVAKVRGLDYSKPLSAMRDYLALMDSSPYRGPEPPEPPIRLVAALGPRMLELSAAAADGAHPYLTTPDHTQMAREAIGPDRLLCVEQKVILSTDADAARAAANAVLDVYARLPNYRNNWHRLGFSEEEVDQRASRFVDAIVVWGDEDRVRSGVEAHYDAGADHVCVQPISTEAPLLAVPWDVLELLAPAS